MLSLDSNRNCVRDAPGSCLTDQSVLFWKDALHFFRKRESQNKSKIFNARFLMKTTTFVGAIKDIELAFTGMESASQHSLLANFFRCMCENKFRQLVSQLMQSHISNLQLSERVCIYSFFKRFCSEIWLISLLGLDTDKDKLLIDKIIELSIIHWHGIISVPLKFESLGFSSKYKKALDARIKLSEILGKLVDDCVAGSTLYIFSQESFSSRSVMLDHLVLVVGALIPKACASVLTSTVISAPHWATECLDERGQFISGDSLDSILHEVARMWPPFVAMRRICKEQDGIQIGDVCVPHGRPVLFHVLAAHRDPQMFNDPDSFSWKRWEEGNISTDCLLWFGIGPRKCIGRTLMQTLFKTSIMEFCAAVQWDVKDQRNASDCEYKWLPVARPSIKPRIKLYKRYSD